ncbi:MAG: beta-ketoacyl-ACP reductase [Pseudomonadales bacterium]|nr:beta-ketoacyl-ACP reductase [Pseudomonadales bacterium]MCP5184879.1 beta-ketoacyl-ACP reductase [Pseudomonadales bacterium]
MSETARVALVTGASRGIGAAIARRLLDDGCHVVGTATSEAGCEAVLAALGPGRVQTAVLRLDDASSIAALYATLEASCGLPAILVNNAGITADNLAMRMTEAQWASVIDTNVTGLFRVVRPALRAMMKARWGRIINLSSVVARMGNAGQINYAASKAAIEGYSRSLALELASRNITVNVVAPGFIATDMTNELTEAQKAQMLARIPLGRVGLGEEVASAVSWLASDTAGYVTGATIPVNGGLYLG